MNKEYTNGIKVSVVIPVYNVELYIVECLNSLINQTLKEIEIILIDDCSTDSSGTICDEYEAKDNRITVIHNEKSLRQGLSRNKGIEIAKGEYIGFVDADDYIDADYYDKLYYAAKTNNSDIAKSERTDVFSDGDKKTRIGLNKKIRKGIETGIPVFLLYTYEHTTAIFKREIIVKNEVKYPDIRNAQDLFFLLEATYFSKSICIVSDTYYYYRIHPNSISASKNKSYFESLLLFFSLYIDFINSHEMEKQHYKLAFTRIVNTAKSNYEDINKDPGMNDFRRAYVKTTLKLLTQCKHDSGYLLDSFFYGFTNDMTVQQLKKSYSYRIGKAILWLPSLLKSLFK